MRIYFDTQNFDRVTRDEKANFVTKLSTIGGTMGLLSGFSIISGIEIIYFASKVVIGFARKHLVRNGRLANNVKQIEV